MASKYIRAKIDILRYDLMGERLEGASIVRDRKYKILRQVSHSIYVVQNEYGGRELLLVPAEGYLCR